MKILFVWTGVTSYMADCWRRLQQEPDIELKVVVEQVTSGREFDAERVLHGLDYALVGAAASQTVQTFQTVFPDVIFAVGWHSKVVREIVTHKEWRAVPKICCFDLPWRWQLRCFAAKFVLWPFLRCYDAAYVPGKACARYAKWLGFRKTYKGLFSIDQGRFFNAEAQRRREGFLYVGRFADEKRLDVLIRAFGRYRELGGAWTFDLYGAGPLEAVLTQAIEQSGNQTIFLHPFAQPGEIPNIYRSHACLLLASAFDPWPLVALEAKAAGCEVIQSDRCGNRFELDTRVVPFGDVEAMAREMKRVEDEAKKSGTLTSDLNLTPYDCKTWAKRTLELCKELRHE